MIKAIVAFYKKKLKHFLEKRKEIRDLAFHHIYSIEGADYLRILPQNVGTFGTNRFLKDLSVIIYSSKILHKTIPHNERAKIIKEFKDEFKKNINSFTKKYNINYNNNYFLYNYIIFYYRFVVFILEYDNSVLSSYTGIYYHLNEDNIDVYAKRFKDDDVFNLFLYYEKRFDEIKAEFDSLKISDQF